MKKNKIIATASAAALAAVVALGGGTLAYFTWTSSEIENVVANNYNWVSLTETKVDESGNETTIGGSAANSTATNDTYELIPGTSQDKNPTVTASYSLDSYVFVEVTDTSSGLITWAIDENAGWKLLTSGENSDGEMEYIYYQLLTASGTGTDVEDEDGNVLTYYVSELNVLQDKEITYSPSITNDDNGITVDETTGEVISVKAANYSLTFQASIMQAAIGDSGTVSPATAYAVLNGATYVELDVASSESLATQLTTALATATADNPVVVVLPEGENVSVTASSLNTAITGTAVVDLNGGTLTVSTNVSVTLSDGDDLTFVDGTVESTDMAGAAYASFIVKSDSSLTLENTTLTSNGAAIYPSGDAAEVNVINSVVNGNGYGIATNAATVDNYNVVINVENSTVTANYCALLINVPGTLNVSNSKVKAGSQALIVRAGTATVTDTNLESTLSSTVEGNGSIWTEYTDGNWGSGNAVPFAVITIGNRNGTYAGDAVVTLDGVTLTYNFNEEGSKGVYLYGGVIYPTTNTEPNKAILNYDSTTCNLGTIVQGETTYTEVNDASVSGQ